MANLDEATIQDAITKCHDYFVNNRGDSHPNAANADGIPYHAKQSGYHWQIHEGSTTSECLAIFCRALAEAGYIEYAQQIGDYIINKLTFDDLKVVQWLVNIIDNGVEMETDVCGNYDGATFSFTSGVGIIPPHAPWYGDKVIPVIDNRYYGIIGAFSTNTTFPYRDLWMEPHAGGTTYEIDSYEILQDTIVDENSDNILFEDNSGFLTESQGCQINLVTPFTGTLQVYYGYRNGTILQKDDLYRTYPLNTKCITDGVNDYQISCATDAIQWSIVALKKLAEVTGDTSYSDYATELRDKIIADSQIATKNLSIFDATNRGLSWFGIFTYNENVGRTSSVLQYDKSHTRFSFNSSTGVTQWGLGNPFSWGSDVLQVGVRGDGSNNLRQVVIQDADNENFYATWKDSSTIDREISFNRGNFTSLSNIFLEASRLSFLDPYVTHWGTGSASFSVTDYNSTWEDSENINYAVWHQWNLHCSAGNGTLFGTGHVTGVDTTDESLVRITLASDAVRKLYYKVIDANGDEKIGKYYLDCVVGPKEFEIRINSDYFTEVPVNPIQNFELFKDDVSDTGIVYIASIRIGAKQLPKNPLQAIKFETRQATSGYFDILYANLRNGNQDAYPYSGVPCFSLEYSEIGLMGWRSGSYTGYTNPFSFIPGNFDSFYACKFLYDGQQKYYKTFGKRGPFYPVYLRNLGENQVYGTLSTWTFEGPDPNTTWAGFQFRSLAAMADHRFFNSHGISANEIGYAWNVLNQWSNFLYGWIKQHNNIPSNFYSDGTITSEYENPSFYALAGRGMLLKFLIDYDPKALFVYKFCYDRLLDLQQPDGSFQGVGQDTYGFEQAECILFLAQLKNYLNDYRYIAGMSTFDFTPNQLYTSSVEFRTNVFEAFSGKETRSSETQFPIRRWRLKFDKTNTNLTDIRTFFNNVKGRYSTFNWVWPTDLGGDGNTYTVRLAEDNMTTAMQYLGYGSFEFVFEAIDTNSYADTTILDMSHNAKYEHMEMRKSTLSDNIVANMSVNLNWQSSRKRWNLTFEKDETDRKWLERFFISKKGKLSSFDFEWSTDLGGDGNTYTVRFDTDSIDFDILYYGFGKLTVPIIEIL